ncbi:MAG: hypothetical protein HYU51_06420 [Candidatus Rokubacteria bacterium]|nr:hypothetical protein [Candidatus Rokubacteria bacterium]
MTSARPARADGLLDGINVREEAVYSLFSSKTRDALTGLRTTSETESYGTKTNVRLNYSLLPKLHLNAGGTYEKDFSNLSADPIDLETNVTRFRPYGWLTLRDPVLGASVGYDLADETVKSSGRPETSLTRETYNAHLEWKPIELPWTQVRYTRTSVEDEPNVTLDNRQDLVFLKSEYLYKGLNAYYAGTYLTTTDELRDLGSTQWSHEGKLLYAITFLADRIALTTDHRIRFTDVTTDVPLRVTGLEQTVEVALVPARGLSSLDDTPADTPLDSTPALIDGNTTVSASATLNIGSDRGLAGDFTRRNVGLEFRPPAAVNRLHVSVDVPALPSNENLPSDISSSFLWEIYTSRDNSTWTLHATVVGSFGPFVRRFELTFPTVTANFIKAVTRPLSGGVIGTTNSSDARYRTIVITEVQAFADRAAPPGVGKQRISQTLRTHNLDVRAALFRSPSLYYQFNADYQELELDDDVQERYAISNGLFFTHRFNPVLSTNVNTSIEFGREREEPRTAALYYASLAATPLPTLTDSLVFSGNQQRVGSATARSHSIVLYNTAQLYRGLDASLNLGAALTSDEEGGRVLSRRRDLYVNVGTSITPHPTFATTVYYLGRLSNLSGSNLGRTRDTTDHRLDLSASFTPVRTLVLSAATSIVAETDRDTTTTQNYGVSWAPFPDGTLQFSVFYAENRLPEELTSRIIQPVVRWYVNARRRSYLEANYQLNTTEAASIKTDSQVVSARLTIDF